MKKIIVLIILLIPVFLTGCWDLTEIENRSYVINLGIDNENGEYLVTYGLAWDDDEKRLGSVKSVRGKSLSYLLENTDISSEKSVFLGHTKALLLGENVLREEEIMKEAVIALRDNYELSPKVLIMECEGMAHDVVKAISEERQMYIWDFYRTNAYNMGHIQKTTFDNIDTQLKREGTAIIPVIKLEDSEILFSGCGIIANGVIARSFSQRDSQLIYILSGEGKGSLFEGEGYVFKIIKSKRSFKEDEGIWRIVFNIKGEIIYSRDEVLAEEIEKMLQGEIERFINEEIPTMPSGDYLDMGKGLIKEYDGNINNIRYSDYKIEPVVHVELINV